jgi:hypothetical protein
MLEKTSVINIASYQFRTANIKLGIFCKRK